jgi:hypothetical protein
MPTPSNQPKLHGVKITDFAMVKSVDSPDIKPNPGKDNKNRILYMSICFLVAYIGLKPSNNLIGVTLKSLGLVNLGFISLIVSYTGNALSTLFAPYLMSKYYNKIRVLFSISSISFVVLVIVRKVAVYCAQSQDLSGFCD